MRRHVIHSRFPRLAALAIVLAVGTRAVGEDPLGIEATRVTLDVNKAPLAEVLAEIEEQTGNRLADFREKFGQEYEAKYATIEVKDQPFWKAVDKLLDSIDMSPYPTSGEKELALVKREPGALRRFDRAAYAGAFRVEATSISADRGLRTPEESNVRVELTIEWEPRLAPVAITQAPRDLKVKCDDGRELPPLGDGEVFDVEVTPGCHAVDATVALQLPAREAKTIASMKGKFMAQVPGKIAELKFEKLATAKDVANELGGATIRLVQAVKNGTVWEIQLVIEAAADSAGGHQGWMYQNECYLLDPKGKRVDNAGYETLQTEDPGFTYLFEIGDKIDGYTLVYRTPTDIVSTPVEFELTDLPLP